MLVLSCSFCQTMVHLLLRLVDQHLVQLQIIITRALPIKALLIIE